MRRKPVGNVGFAGIFLKHIHRWEGNGVPRAARSGQLDLHRRTRHIGGTGQIPVKRMTDPMDDITGPSMAGQFGLSEAAAKRITAMLENEPDGSFFRVAVNGGGCSGFQYEFTIDTARQEDDLGFVSHGVEVVIDEISLELVENAELDYVQDLMGAYFAVSNPNATASCGCGTSFSV